MITRKSCVYFCSFLEKIGKNWNQKEDFRRREISDVFASLFFVFRIFIIFAPLKKIMKKVINIIFLLWACLGAWAQPNMENIQLDNMIYADGIKSVTLTAGYNLGKPVITLGSGELTLTFDDLAEESRYVKYTLIHCTHDWKPSDMNQIEYLDGFMEDEVSTYNYSFNTVTHYMQYSLTIPNDNMRPTKSGNYILFVYDDTPDHPLLTRRLMIREDSQAGITGDVHSASDVADRFTRQEVDFTVNSGPYVVRNPIMTLHATIQQNDRWDNAITGLTYRSGFPGEYSFDYDDGRNTFDGSAEFRTFDIRTLRTNGDRIVGITFAHHENQAYVLQDDARPFGAYESRNTLNGACIYQNTDMSNPFSEDYVNTHFTLKSPFPFTDGDVYVFGQLTDWRILPEAKLHFNEEYKFWETAFPVKQGAYNYQYVYVPHGSSKIDATYIEGNHYETHNDYTVYVYFREEGSSYDRLIGVAFLNAGNR